MFISGFHFQKLTIGFVWHHRIEGLDSKSITCTIKMIGFRIEFTPYPLISTICIPLLLELQIVVIENLLTTHTYYSHRMSARIYTARIYYTQYTHDTPHHTTLTLHCKHNINMSTKKYSLCLRTMTPSLCGIRF